MPELNRYLTVTGVVTDDNQLDLQPGFLTDNGAGRSGGAIEQPLITVELLDGEGELIGRQPVAASSLCGYSDPSSSHLFLADKIPFPPGTRLIRFRWAYNDALLHELRVPGAPPQIRLRWTPPADGVEGEQVISWEARHPEDLPLQFIVLYTHNDGMSWRPLCLPQESNEFVVDFNALPGGIGHIKVLATDGVNTTEAASRRFAVQEKGYAAFIISPPDGTSIPADQAAWLQGQGLHLEEERAELEQLAWASSIDGQLGTGPLVEAHLSQGSHRITLTVGNAQASVSLNVEPLV
jgi:hypothetical protein